MPQLFHFDDDTGDPFTGTSLTSLVGGALPEIPAATAQVRERIAFDVVYDFLNVTALKRSIDFDIYIAGVLAQRIPLHSLRSHTDTRTHRVQGVITIKSASEALLVATANAASPATADDERVMSVKSLIDFDTSNDQTIDFRATLSTTSDIDTLKITPVDINIDKQLYGSGTTTVIPGGGQVYTDVASEAAMLALPAVEGDFAVRSDFVPAQTYLLTADPASTLANWLLVGGGGTATIPPDVVRARVMVNGVYSSPTGGFFPAPVLRFGLTPPDGSNESQSLISWDLFFPSTGT